MLLSKLLLVDSVELTVIASTLACTRGKSNRTIGEIDTRLGNF